MTDPTQWTQHDLMDESERIYELESATDKDTPLPEGTVVSRPNQTKSAMFSLRLNPDELSAVQRIAEDLGVPASALVRGWIVQRLAAEGGAADGDVVAVVQRIEADAHRLRELIT